MRWPPVPTVAPTNPLPTHPPTPCQSLALYGTFRMAQRMPGGDKMAALTRVLHRTEVGLSQPWLGWAAGAARPRSPHAPTPTGMVLPCAMQDDELSPFVPTFRANPLHPGAPPVGGCTAAPPGRRTPAAGSQRRGMAQPCPPGGPTCACRPGTDLGATALPPLLPAGCDGGKPRLCRYPVADRANAVKQFLAAADREPSLIQARQAPAAGARVDAGLGVPHTAGSLYAARRPGLPCERCPSPPRPAAPPRLRRRPQAPWLFLIETDFLFARPVAAPGPAEDPAARPQAFFYSYIFPQARVMQVRCRGGVLGGMNAHAGGGLGPAVAAGADRWAAARGPRQAARHLASQSAAPPTRSAASLPHTERDAAILPAWHGPAVGHPPHRPLPRHGPPARVAARGAAVGRPDRAGTPQWRGGAAQPVAVPGRTVRPAHPRACLAAPPHRGHPSTPDPHYADPSLTRTSAAIRAASPTRPPLYPPALPSPSPAPPAPPQIEEDEEFINKVAWVREMYAFSMAAAVDRLNLDIQVGAAGGALP